MEFKYDFSGWATRHNTLCSDGRTILPNAFKDNDGQIVPLVWNHDHHDSHNVLGHALLQNTPDGVYAYCSFNNTKSGQTAKMLVNHGDIKSLSIYANKLKQVGGNVVHGAIREVSLVLAGANPDAIIDSIIEHGEFSDEEAIIYSGEDISLYHEDGFYEEDAEVYDENERYEEDDGCDEIEHSEDPEENDEEEETMADEKTIEDEKTVEDVVNSMTEEQKNVMYFLIGQVLEDKNEQGGSETMKHNVFEDYDYDNYNNPNFLSHSDMETIINDAKRYGSVKDSFLAHAEDYGIDGLEWLFPEDRNLNVPPEFISRDMTWVQKVMGSVKHSPFSRVKSMFADITEDQARAKGYLKGNLKKDEVFSLLKRSTSPTTIYKKQKMDRDDVIDITDFDVISWLKGEMRLMLDEEIARAILIGDGRLSSDDDKIDESHVRPILNDADLFVVRWGVDDGSGEDDLAKNFIKAAIKARKDYKGSGNPVLFTTEEMLTNMLLLEDTLGHALYKTESELATKLRVREIVTVEVMEGLEDKDSKDVYGIIVNLADYNVGADKGGAINMFDDFDIDYNQQKYLIETRCSGALVKPFSAIVLREHTATAKVSKDRSEAMAEYK